MRDNRIRCDGLGDLEVASGRLSTTQHTMNTLYYTERPLPVAQHTFFDGHTHSEHEARLS